MRARFHFSTIDLLRYGDSMMKTTEYIVDSVYISLSAAKRKQTKFSCICLMSSKQWYLIYVWSLNSVWHWPVASYGETQKRQGNELLLMSMLRVCFMSWICLKWPNACQAIHIHKFRGYFAFKWSFENDMLRHEFYYSPNFQYARRYCPCANTSTDGGRLDCLLAGWKWLFQTKHTTAVNLSYGQFSSRLTTQTDCSPWKI